MSWSQYHPKKSKIQWTDGLARWRENEWNAILFISAAWITIVNNNCYNLKSWSTNFWSSIWALLDIFSMHLYNYICNIFHAPEMEILLDRCSKIISKISFSFCFVFCVIPFEILSFATPSTLFKNFKRYYCKWWNQKTRYGLLGCNTFGFIISFSKLN